MQHLIVVNAVCAILSQYFRLGLGNQLSNLFIYPPDYVKSAAPRLNQSGEMICTVGINLEIWAINEISLQTQDIEVDLTLKARWKDYRLTINPNVSSGNMWPFFSKYEAEQIWMPAILFRNCKGCLPVRLRKSEQMYVSRQSGVIVAQSRSLHKFTCAIDLRAYPMDIQFCQIQLYNSEPLMNMIQFQHQYPDKKVITKSNVTLGEYRTALITKTSCLVEDAEGDVFSCVELRIRLEHLVTYHLMTSYTPTAFIVMLSWISFWLPVDMAPARVALGLTSLLTLATRLDQAQRNLPPVAYAKAIDVWMFACILLVSGSLCEFAVSYNLYELSKTRSNLECRISKVRPLAEKMNKFVAESHVSGSSPSDYSSNYVGTTLDFASRIIFPLAFLCFNIAYWSYYLTYYN